MTCIVGIAEGGKVCIGGDSAGVSGYTVTVRSDPKVFRTGAFLVGFTTSYRMGQLLRYAFHAPVQPEGVDTFEYMVTLFVETIRECLKTGGYAKKELEQETGGSFLVGYAGHLFQIDNDYQVGECAEGYMAVGSGKEIALGALYVTRGQAPHARVEAALAAAAHHTAYICGPFVIEEI